MTIIENLSDLIGCSKAQIFTKSISRPPRFFLLEKWKQKRIWELIRPDFPSAVFLRNIFSRFWRFASCRERLFRLIKIYSSKASLNFTFRSSSCFALFSLGGCLHDVQHAPLVFGAFNWENCRDRWWGFASARKSFRALTGGEDRESLWLMCKSTRRVTWTAVAQSAKRLNGWENASVDSCA